MALKGFGFGRLFQRDDVEGEQSVSPEERMRSDEYRDYLPPAQGTTVLIADDSRTIQTVVGKILTRHGYTTLAAFDGESAVTMAREHKPTVILMDVVMPGMNGFQATREIRKDEDPLVASIPVLIMSGNAQPSEELWSVKIKANGFLAKPFDDSELLRYLEHLLYPNLSSA
jgi:twitching motility two-component system response regulator PilH